VKRQPMWTDGKVALVGPWPRQGVRQPIEALSVWTRRKPGHRPAGDAIAKAVREAVPVIIDPSPRRFLGVWSYVDDESHFSFSV
jgi:hypothetical protein